MVVFCKSSGLRWPLGSTLFLGGPMSLIRRFFASKSTASIDSPRFVEGLENRQVLDGAAGETVRPPRPETGTEVHRPARPERTGETSRPRAEAAEARAAQRRAAAIARREAAHAAREAGRETSTPRVERTETTRPRPAETRG
jgi:hypothetical protein